MSKSFAELDRIYRSLPIWKRFLWAFGCISVPALDDDEATASDRRGPDGS